MVPYLCADRFLLSLFSADNDDHDRGLRQGTESFPSFHNHGLLDFDITSAHLEGLEGGGELKWDSSEGNCVYLVL